MALLFLISQERFLIEQWREGLVVIDQWKPRIKALVLCMKFTCVLIPLRLIVSSLTSTV